MGANKKKLEQELETYFPAYFGSDLEHINKIREMYLYKIEKALGEKRDKDLEVVYDYFLSINKPKVFNPFDSRCVLTGSDLEFETVCLTMEESGVNNAKESTVFEFYSKIKYLESKAAKMK